MSVSIPVVSVPLTDDEKMILDRLKLKGCTVVKMLTGNGTRITITKPAPYRHSR